MGLQEKKRKNTAVHRLPGAILKIFPKRVVIVTTVTIEYSHPLFRRVELFFIREEKLHGEPLWIKTT